MNLLPTKIAPYAKAWLTLIGVAIATLTTLTDLPTWATIAGSLATTIAVYLTPNTPAPTRATVETVPDTPGSDTPAR